MSLLTAKKIVDFVWGISDQGESIKLGFSGGEPLLLFDLIKRIISYIEAKNEQNFHPVTFGITTNGTLISKNKGHNR